MHRKLQIITTLKNVYNSIKIIYVKILCVAPYISAIITSKSNLEVAKMISWQDVFTIVSVDGKVSVYTDNGVIGVHTVENEISSDDKNFDGD